MLFGQHMTKQEDENLSSVHEESAEMVETPHKVR